MRVILKRQRLGYASTEYVMVRAGWQLSVAERQSVTAVRPRHRGKHETLAGNLRAAMCPTGTSSAYISSHFGFALEQILRFSLRSCLGGFYPARGSRGLPASPR